MKSKIRKVGKRYEIDIKDSSGKRHRPKFATMAEARAEVERIQGQKVAGSFIASATATTFDQAFDLWVNDLKQKGRAQATIDRCVWFPGNPSLRDRGQRDHCGERYVEMQSRGELSVLGEQTVPVRDWLAQVFQHVEGQTVAALLADRYKQSELGEAIDKLGIRVPVIWRGFGFRDGGEDCERFRRACFDGRVKAAPSLLLRSALADTICLRDPANNIKLAKARSNGKIDSVAASVLAVAEGARMVGRGEKKPVRAFWA
jgi:phage terminase large subunit-like protein